MVLVKLITCSNVVSNVNLWLMLFTVLLMSSLHMSTKTNTFTSENNVIFSLCV